MTQALSAFAGLCDLASRAIGGEVVCASDEFFAAKENLVEPLAAVFSADRFTERGKWMDGWETRRRRAPGHDWCIVKLGARGVIHGVDIDTSHFLGNHPPLASLDACLAAFGASAEHLQAADWAEIVAPSPLRAGAQNLFSAAARGPFSHLRLHIYPDGGVARLRVFGEVAPAELPAGPFDLCAVEHGGRALACSDMFFSPMFNLILPGRAGGMAGGWETRRRRAPGCDWLVVKLAAPGLLDAIEIDTAFFKGNYPDRAAVDGLCWPDAPLDALVPPVFGRVAPWRRVLPEQKLRADSVHRFGELAFRGPLSHLRLTISPCGGVSRLRALGSAVARAAVLATAEREQPGLARLNALGENEAVAALMRCCGSSRWARAMAARRPFEGGASLFGFAEQCWWRLSEPDWLEAFAHHPEVGAVPARLREKFAASAAWSAGEQSGVSAASEATLAALAQGNRDYRARFGFVFLVCASGKNADEVLALLRERMESSRPDELLVAAGEQAEITRLRLAKLLDELAAISD